MPIFAWTVLFLVAFGGLLYSMTVNSTYLPTFVIQGFYVPVIFFAAIGIIAEMGDQINETDDPITKGAKRVGHRVKTRIRRK